MARKDPKAKMKIICIVIFMKIRLSAISPKFARNVDLTKKRIIMIGQIFFKSCDEGPIIAPTLKNKRIITQLCHSDMLICRNNPNVPVKRFCHPENCGIMK